MTLFFLVAGVVAIGSMMYLERSGLFSHPPPAYVKEPISDRERLGVAAEQNPEIAGFLQDVESSIAAARRYGCPRCHSTIDEKNVVTLVLERGDVGGLPVHCVVECEACVSYAVAWE